MKRSNLWDKDLKVNVLCTSRNGRLKNKAGSVLPLRFMKRKKTFGALCLHRLATSCTGIKSLFEIIPPTPICMQQTFTTSRYRRGHSSHWICLDRDLRKWVDIWSRFIWDTKHQGLSLCRTTERAFIELVQWHSNPYAPSLTRHKVNYMASLQHAARD